MKISATNIQKILQLGGFCILAGLCTIFIFSSYVLLIAQKHTIDLIEDLELAQTIIVLGAGVSSSGELSQILKDRVDTALIIYQAGKAERILVSGDNSTLGYNEVIPVRTYLLERGVPASQIFLDYAGFNTYDSIYRARDVFEVDSAIVVTQEFHLPRAVYIGDSLGLEVQGYSSEITNVYFINHVREALTRMKSVVEVILHRQPKFLGEVISIEGDGRETI